LSQTRLALVVGHDELNPGARGAPPITGHEYDYNKDLAMMVSSHLIDFGIISQIFLRDHVGIIGAYKGVAEFEANACVELHFNAFDGKHAGTETLYVTKQSLVLAEDLQAFISQVFERDAHDNRGVQQLAEGDERGYVNLTQVACPSVLIEPFFGDNPMEAAMAVVKKPELALAIAQAIQYFFTPSTNSQAH
jgi:N-acetylmuramoyl-L-alanine amidase